MNFLKSALLVSFISSASVGKAQSLNQLHLQMQNQMSVAHAALSDMSTTTVGITTGLNPIKPFSFPAPSNANGTGLRKAGKIMMISGGALYLLGFMVGTTHGDGNLETGTALAVAGGVVCATGVPLYIIGRHKMKHQ